MLGCALPWPGYGTEVFIVRLSAERLKKRVGLLVALC